MKGISCLIAAILFMINAPAQNISDDFSDGNFSSDPSWSGTTNQFIVNPFKQLQLNNSVSGTSYLSVPLPLLNAAREWRFFLKMAFSPSSSNSSKIWLMADSSDLQLADGYYLQFGETGSNDAIELFRKNSGIQSSLCTGSAGQIAASFSLFVKVQHLLSGEWKVFTSGDGLSYELQCETTDTTSTSGSYSGFCFNYTSSNANRFYIDDFYYGPATEDSIAPNISEINVAGRKHLQVRFSEAVDKNSAEDPSSYSLSPSIIIDSLYRDENEADLVHLIVIDSLDNQSYTLESRNICDPYQNCTTSTKTFSSFFASMFDVVINEIMADPTPSQGIPECEYVELLNRTGNRIDISGWKLLVNGSEKLIENAKLEPHGFLLLTSASCLSEFDLLADATAVSGFSTTTLTNGGATLELKDKEGERIHYINYDQSWYNDVIRESGGWSIEQINPDAVCSDRNNWRASRNSEGGTPGIPNSVMFRGLSSQPALLESTCILDEKTISLQFSSSTLINQILDPSLFSISNGSVNADSVTSAQGTITLYLDRALQENISYSLLISQALMNCRNESFAIPPLTFSVNDGDQNEIIITEIMADPDPAHSLPPLEYLELYNASSYPVNLGSWKICSNGSCTTLPCEIIPAGTYRVLSEGKHAAFQNLLQTDLPSLSNEGGHITLLNKEDKVISSLQYSADWHAALKKGGGWSLEIKDLSNPCGERENWTSSTSVSGGTPGVQNSVYSAFPDLTNPMLRYAVIKDEYHIQLYFDEMLNMELLPVINIDQGIGSPVQVIPSDDLKSLLIETSLPLFKGIRYSITVSNASDCSGNQSNTITANTGWPEEIEAGDIIINEILADTRHPDEEFIELYNRSEKILSLKGLAGGTPDTLFGNISGMTLLDTTGYLLFPGEYVALCRDQRILCRFYNCISIPSILPISTLPSLSEEGCFALSTLNGNQVDRVDYDGEMHFSLLDETEGISLERISPERSSSDRTNWHSASRASGGATPGHINSQHDEASSTSTISISPEVFTPDNDGVNDVLNISFDLDAPGKVSNVFIFSETGSLERKLIENQIAGTRGAYSWDGVGDNGELCRTGIYIVYFETFDPGGTVKNYKQTCVLSGRR